MESKHAINSFCYRVSIALIISLTRLNENLWVPPTEITLNSNACSCNFLKPIPLYLCRRHYHFLKCHHIRVLLKIKFKNDLKWNAIDVSLTFWNSIPFYYNIIKKKSLLLFITIFWKENYFYLAVFKLCCKKGIY